jgi:hypothetical protein
MITYLLSFFLLVQVGLAQNEHFLYVSVVFGRDVPNCGSNDIPCKSLSYAFNRAAFLQAIVGMLSALLGFHRNLCRDLLGARGHI